MEFLVDREIIAGLSDGQSESGECGFGVAGVGELFGYGDTRRIDDLLFQFVPEAGAFQSLDGGCAVGGEFRLRDRDGADVGFRQIVESVEIGTAGRPDNELAARVDGAGIRKNETILDELIDVFDVGGEENVEGCAVFDLLGELRGGAEAGDDVDFGLVFEGAAEVGRTSTGWRPRLRAGRRLGSSGDQENECEP